MPNCICICIVYILHLFVSLYVTSWSLNLSLAFLASCFSTWPKYQDKNLNILRARRAIKVARVVNLKLVFTEWFFCNLVILIKLYKIRYLNLDKALSFLRKLWRAPTLIKFNILCWNFAHVSYLTISTKGYSGSFLFCLDLDLLIKM